MAKDPLGAYSCQLLAIIANLRNDHYCVFVYPTASTQKTGSVVINSFDSLMTQMATVRSREKKAEALH